MNTRGFARFLSLLGIAARGPTNTANTTVGASTLTAASFFGGYITRSGSTAAYTDTTPTITALVGAIPSGELVTGLAWELTIKNNTSFVQTLTAGTGGTLSGITSIPPFSVGTFLVTINSTSTYTMVGMSLAPLLTNFSELVLATNVLTAAENGATFYLSAAAGFLTTLPAPAVGLTFDMIVVTAPTSVGYTITAPAAATILFGSSHSAQGGASGIGTGEATFTFVANQAAIGDCVYWKSDGTNWYFRAFANLDAAITIA